MVRISGEQVRTVATGNDQGVGGNLGVFHQMSNTGKKPILKVIVCTPDIERMATHDRFNLSSRQAKAAFMLLSRRTWLNCRLIGVSMVSKDIALISI